MYTRLFCLLCATSLWLAGCLKPDKPAERSEVDRSQVVASHGEIRISIDELKQVMANLPAARRAKLTTRAGKKQLLKFLIRAKAFEREVRRRKIDKNPDASRPITRVLYRALIEQINKEVTDRITVTDSDVETFYREHPEWFRQPRSASATWITIRDKAAAKRMAGKLRRDAKVRQSLLRTRSFEGKPLSFGFNGRITVKTTGAPREVVQAALTASKANETKGPVGTNDTWHVVLVHQVHEAHVQSLDSQREQIRQIVKRDRLKQATDAILGKIFDPKKITYNVPNLDRAQVPNVADPD